MKFGHVGLSVSNLARSKAFYRKHLGLVCKTYYRFAETGMNYMLLQKGDIKVELFEFKKHAPLPKSAKSLDVDLRTLGVKHFSIDVVRIDALYKKFKKARVAFATGVRTFKNGCRYFFIKDPDGILIEVMEAKKR